MSLKRRINRQLERAAAARATKQRRADAELAAARARAETTAYLGGYTRPPRDNTVARDRARRALKHALSVFATAAAAGLKPRGRQPAGSGGDNTGGRP